MQNKIEIYQNKNGEIEFCQANSKTGQFLVEKCYILKLKPNARVKLKLFYDIIDETDKIDKIDKKEKDANSNSH